MHHQLISLSLLLSDLLMNITDHSIDNRLHLVKNLRLSHFLLQVLLINVESSFFPLSQVFQNIVEIALAQPVAKLLKLTASLVVLLVLFNFSVNRQAVAGETVRHLPDVAQLVDRVS